MHALVMKAQHYLNGGSLTNGSSSSLPSSSSPEATSISSSSALSSSSAALSDSYRASATPLQSQQIQPQPPLSLSQPSSHHPSAAVNFALFDPTAPSLQSTPQTFLATNGITQLTAIPSALSSSATVASIDTLGHSMLGSGLSQKTIEIRVKSIGDILFTIISKGFCEKVVLLNPTRVSWFCVSPSDSLQASAAPHRWPAADRAYRVISNSHRRPIRPLLCRRRRRRRHCRRRRRSSLRRRMPSNNSR
jgi:hypothetical protein